MMPTILASKVEYVASGYSRFDIILIFMYSVFGNSNLYLFDVDIKKMKAAEKV